MWHARQDGAEEDRSAMALHYKANAHGIDDGRGSDLKFEHSGALRTNKMVGTAGTPGMFNTSAMSRSATGTPPHVFCSFGMSVVGGY